MKALVRRLLVPLGTLAVLAGLVWYGNGPRVLATAEKLHVAYLPWYLCVLVAHEIARGLLWLLLLRALGVGTPLRTRVFVFAVGETMKAVPAGVYLQNYLLRRSRGASIGRTSAATTLIILAEIGVALLGVIVLGIGAWSTWLRPAIGLLVVVLVVIGGILAAADNPKVPGWVRGHRILARVIEELRRFRAGAAALAKPPVLAATLLLCAVYVFLSAVDLYLVILALGIGGVSLQQATAVSCFGLAFYMILGSLEVAGVAALIGSGVSKTAAVSAILVNRALGIFATAALAGIVMLLTRDRASKERQPQRIQS